MDNFEIPMDDSLSRTLPRILERFRLQDELAIEGPKLYEISVEDLSPKERRSLWEKRVQDLRRKYRLGFHSEEFYFWHAYHIVDDFINFAQWIEGSFDPRLQSILERTKETNRKLGYDENADWKRGEAPLEIEKLNAEFNEASIQINIEILDRVGAVEIVEVYQRSRDKFDRLTHFANSPKVSFASETENIETLLERLRLEFELCRKSKAYYAACVLAGSSMEAQLTLLCLKNVDETENARKRWVDSPDRKRSVSKNPLDWELGTLLDILDIAGLVPDIKISEDVVVSLVDIGNIVRKARNLIHPGRHAKEMSWLLNDPMLEDIEAYFYLVDRVVSKLRAV